MADPSEAVSRDAAPARSRLVRWLEAAAFADDARVPF